MTDREKLYARLDALRAQANALWNHQIGPTNPVHAAEYYRLCAAIAARQSETLLELATILEAITEPVEMRADVP